MEYLLGGNPVVTWFFICLLFYQPMAQIKVPSRFTLRLLPHTLLSGEALFRISHQTQLNRIKMKPKLVDKWVYLFLFPLLVSCFFITTSKPGLEIEMHMQIYY